MILKWRCIGSVQCTYGNGNSFFVVSDIKKFLLCFVNFPILICPVVLNFLSIKVLSMTNKLTLGSKISLKEEKNTKKSNLATLYLLPTWAFLILFWSYWAVTFSVCDVEHSELWIGTFWDPGSEYNGTLRNHLVHFGTLNWDVLELTH